jgi:hypothetical protein
MKRILGYALVLAVVAVGGLRVGATREKEKENAEGNIGHMVYFKLKSNADSDKKKLVDACKKYLVNHEGTVYFSAGVLAEDFKREVNDRDFDVALHLVFKNRAAHDRYQDHPRHTQFIEENKANWSKVRVFDAVVK